MADFKTLDDINVTGKRVLVRTDLNVPMRNGQISDTTRIDRTLPTLKELSGKGAKIILLSHYGRPKGERMEELSLQPVAKHLARVYGDHDVRFCNEVKGEKVKDAIKKLSSGDILVLENLRFEPGEEKDDDGFAKQLAALGDIFVNDAFSCSHRAHASVHAITKHLPSVAGRLMQTEIEALTAALETPEKPVAALVGGAKISTKLDVLGHLCQKVQALIIGGGMANTFLHAKGVDVGKSLCEHDLADEARAIMQSAKKAGCDVVLPEDVVVAAKFEAGAQSQTVGINDVPSDKMILDIGPRAIEDLKIRLAQCKTLVWNGPLGAFEVEPFDRGTVEVAREAARLTKGEKLLSVAGGGDTVSALSHAGVVDDFSYVSTAGGAFLEWLEGKELPGVAALRKQS